jgi:uncharacterized membrane protein SirB2
MENVVSNFESPEISIKLTDEKRWYAFGGALLMFAYIAKVAVTKSAMFF